ncbi:unnamed protein product [Leuciscus chuanchicus]
MLAFAKIKSMAGGLLAVEKGSHREAGPQRWHQHTHTHPSPPGRCIRLDRTEGKVPGMQTPLPYPGMRFGDRTGGQVTEQGKEDIVCMQEGASTHHPDKESTVKSLDGGCNAQLLRGQPAGMGAGVVWEGKWRVVYEVL